MNAVDITGLTYNYDDGTEALKEIHLKIEKNKKTAILGSNGSGKTTLIYHLNGIFLPQQGQITVMGYPLKKENISKIRQMVGLLFDNPDNQLFSTTVFNDIAFGPRNLKLSEEEVLSRTLSAMKRVNIEVLKDKPPYNLSLGQKKKVAIAGLLAMEPEMMVCDEPFSGLDPYSTGQMVEILNDLNSKGATLILSTHDVNLAFTWADQVIIMKEGKVLAAGEVELLTDRELMLQAFLEVPMLAEIFKGTGFKPRNAEEAVDVIKFYIQKV
ncbi:ATP-binding cassette domain-containing protein [Candidatus Contubernalis alkaliaceticus]|uniref:ATP-binding cassette domain-containing protein n=1 Tax=Candidatus Contubernalis alkaliaceticus TaxID=338645 RepID=UPI001F4BD94C|nr:ATP-binding cassette domain-containing protein [Candidatus Contubernalis alkalaceticus]UNC93113.1 ATP-binding cassette domain-containing protein [Candidatus Contubernalis alkalaceticus]